MHGLSGFAYVWLHVYARLRVEVKNHPSLLFYLIHGGRVSQTNSKPACSGELSLPPPFLPSEDGITGGCHAHPPSVYMGFLGPIHIHGILTLVLAFI